MHENPFGIQRDCYTYSVPAAALLIEEGTIKGIRVEAQTIGIEYCDHSYVGTDPEGILSYHDYKDFGIGQTPPRDAYYVVTTFTRMHHNKPQIYVRIPFYHKGPADKIRCHDDWEYKTAAEEKPFAVFLAEDRYNVANKLKGYGTVGNWRATSLASASAVVTKAAGDANVTLVAAPCKKKSVWSVKAHPELVQKRVDVPGVLYYKHIDHADGGNYVNYNNGRLIFYKNHDDFAAYFIPFDRHEVSSLRGHQSDHLLGLKEDTIFQQVVWDNTK